MCAGVALNVANTVLVAGGVARVKRRPCEHQKRCSSAHGALVQLDSSTEGGSM